MTMSQDELATWSQNPPLLYYVVHNKIRKIANCRYPYVVHSKSGSQSEAEKWSGLEVDRGAIRTCDSSNLAISDIIGNARSIFTRKKYSCPLLHRGDAYLSLEGLHGSFKFYWEHNVFRVTNRKCSRANVRSRIQSDIIRWREQGRREQWRVYADQWLSTPTALAGAHWIPFMACPSIRAGERTCLSHADGSNGTCF